VLLLVGLPVLPLYTAIRHGIVKARSDYQDELGWPTLARQVERLAPGSDVVLASNYGEAGALELFGHALPPVASGDVSFRYWRPALAGRAALLVGFTRGKATFCHGYRVVGRITMPTANAERGQPIARCTLDRTLAAAWPHKSFGSRADLSSHGKRAAERSIRRRPVSRPNGSGERALGQAVHLSVVSWG
jgi:hypothetical protein